MTAGHVQHEHGKRSPSAAGVDGLSTVENQNKSRGNEPYTLAIRPLYEDLGGEVRKGVLTREADNAAKGDGDSTDGGSLGLDFGPERGTGGHGSS
jgi:hypothetical protein